MSDSEKMLSNFILSGPAEVRQAFDDLLAARDRLQVTANAAKGVTRRHAFLLAAADEEQARLEAKLHEEHRIPWRNVVAMARKLVFYWEKDEREIADGYVAAVKDALEKLDESAPSAAEEAAESKTVDEQFNELQEAISRTLYGENLATTEEVTYLLGTAEGLCRKFRSARDILRRALHASAELEERMAAAGYALRTVEDFDELATENERMRALLQVLPDQVVVEGFHPNALLPGDGTPIIHVAAVLDLLGESAETDWHCPCGKRYPRHRRTCPECGTPRVCPTCGGTGHG